MGVTVSRAIKRPYVASVLAALVMAAACARPSDPDGVEIVVARLESSEPAVRSEAVVQLSTFAPSQERRAGLARAVRDEDERVRLLAALVVLGDGPTEHAGWLPLRHAKREPAARTPNPSKMSDLSPLEALVYLDPWFAGTLRPGALVASRDGDERVRALGRRALLQMDAYEAPRTSASDGEPGGR